MRVIAGSAGGVRLAVPKRGVRPTMDRVKAAIFSSLGDAIVGARVLDLFAGTGALGIEALSRGASSAVFVEESRQSVEVLEKNLTKTKLKGRIRNQDVFDFLRKACNSESYQMIRFIYNLFWPIGLLFFLPGYFTKMIRRGGYREKFGQRVGLYDRELRDCLSKQTSTWLHAVSVGEVNIALKLANALRTLES